MRSTKPEYVVEAATGCWAWQRGKTSKGYGAIYHDGRVLPAHRVVYERANGPIAEGMTLDHLCRNRACVNPDHLEPVSNRENILRGESPAAGYARQTHCHRGHPLYGDNLYVGRSGKRTCRACRLDRERSRTGAGSKGWPLRKVSGAEEERKAL